MGIKFLKKNKIDLSISNVAITVTDAVASNDGTETVDRLRNRSNFSGFATTGSSDAANTTLVFDTTDQKEIDHLILIKHNFKAYTIQYWNGSAYVDFSTPINVSNNADETTWHTFTKVSTSRLKIIITGAIVADADKTWAQFIATELIGEFTKQPEIQPVFDKNRKATRYLSGRKHITKSIGSFAARVTTNNIVLENDLAIVEELFDSFEGFLIWPCGGDVDQYPTSRVGYKLHDIYLVNCENEFEPQWERSRPSEGMKIDLKLAEVN